MTPLRRPLLLATAAIVGAILFVYAVRSAGVTEIVSGVRRIGWGLLVIVAIGGARFVVRAQCWRLCVPSSTHLGFGHAFVAFVAGDAVGTVTPLGLLASEPTKVLLTRHHLATRESVASLALENLVYAVSVVVMISAGIVVLLATVALPAGWREGLLAALAVAVAGVMVVLVTMRSVPQSTATSGWRGKLASLRHDLSQVPGVTLIKVLLLDLGYHALAVLEVFVTLEWLLGGRSPTIAQAIVFEALNRVVTVAFKFVPFRVGIDEALTGALAPVLTLNPVAGVTLAIVRKVRNLFWAAIGLIFVATHPARSR